jgi:multidrug efflux pump subunit AcrA (membrane-fusion protein)
MTHFPALALSRPALLAALLTLAALPVRADDDEPKGPAISTLKATKACFSNIVEVSGTILARDEAQAQVRPDRPGLKVAEVLADAGDVVTAGQVLARLSTDGGLQNITAPNAGLVIGSTAVVGAIASARGEALFTILTRYDYDLIGLVPVVDLGKLAVGQQASIRVIGIPNDIDAKVRRIAPTTEPNVQLGQAFIGITTNRKLPINASGRALIKVGQSCNVSVPLSAVQYGPAGTVVQVVRRSRIETKRVEVGLASGGQVEIRDGLNEGEDVVARAGALLREGDVVRPVQVTAK